MVHYMKQSNGTKMDKKFYITLLAQSNDVERQQIFDQGNPC